MRRRTAAHAGTFYPADMQEIKKYFNAFEEAQTEKPDIVPRAMIVPHAGYIYSGLTAESAYRTLVTSDVKRAIVIGPSHRISFSGMSVSLYDTYETPLGNLLIDTAYANRVLQTYHLDFEPKMHQEHSTEVQMPFLKYFAPKIQVIEMVYGDFSPHTLSKIITDLLNDPDNLIVISTDLSHFYTEKEATQLDSICLKAIEELNPERLHQGCQACGKIGIEAILISAKALGLQSKILDYRTSAWVTNDKLNVVGYASTVFY